MTGLMLVPINVISIISINFIVIFIFRIQPLFTTWLIILSRCNRMLHLVMIFIDLLMVIIIDACYFFGIDLLLLIVLLFLFFVFNIIQLI